MSQTSASAGVCRLVRSWSSTTLREPHDCAAASQPVHEVGPGYQTVGGIENGSATVR